MDYAAPLPPEPSPYETRTRGIYPETQADLAALLDALVANGVTEATMTDADRSLHLRFGVAARAELPLPAEEKKPVLSERQKLEVNLFGPEVG